MESLADYAQKKKIGLRSISMFRLFLDKKNVVKRTYTTKEWDDFYEKYRKEGVTDGR